MAKSKETLSGYKKYIYPNTRLEVTNYVSGAKVSGVVYKVCGSYIILGERVEKEYYDEQSPKMKKGSFIISP